MQRLAEQLASVKGDSLSAYFRAYWKSKTKPASVVRIDNPTAPVVVDSANATEEAMRSSIVEMETCQMALDSNRAVVNWYNEIYPKAVVSIDSLQHLPQPIPWRALGTGFSLGFILGLTL